MIYHAVGNLCAVDLEDLELPITKPEAINILEDLGFKISHVDIIEMAKKCVGVSEYNRGARIEQAPEIVDCSSFTKWLYSRKGIWLPRHSIDQFELGEEVSDQSDFRQGDLVFTTGFRNYFWENPNEGIGHVGVYSGDQKVIHAANSKSGVVESPFDRFVKPSWRVRRMFRRNNSVITIKSPSTRVVEWSREFRWIILQCC